MRKFAIVLLLASSMLAFAQDKPQLKESTVAEMRLTLAQKDVEIAQLKLQLIQAQAQLAYDKTQAELAAAQKAVQDATPKPELKK
jgi:hypothetical protein